MTCIIFRCCNAPSGRKIDGKCCRQAGTMLLYPPTHVHADVCDAQWVNLATVGLLLFAPGNLQLEAAVYALADGPLAAALIAWQSAWVFGSPSHVIRYGRAPYYCDAVDPNLQSDEEHFRVASDTA